VADEHEQALAAFLRIFDERLASAPLVEQRHAEREGLIEAQRASGPVEREFAYWVEPRRPARD
jgi:hypothetical protein